MKRDVEYRIRVEAKYKDFQPLVFNFKVKYLPSLDGKIRFVDLGTHVFYKTQNRPMTPYKFELANVLNDGLEDDSNDFTFTLSNSQSSYYQLAEQENLITILPKDVNTVPTLGENTVTVKPADNTF